MKITSGPKTTDIDLLNDSGDPIDAQVTDVKLDISFGDNFVRATIEVIGLDLDLETKIGGMVVNCPHCGDSFPSENINGLDCQNCGESLIID